MKLPFRIEDHSDGIRTSIRAPLPKSVDAVLAKSSSASVPINEAKAQVLIVEDNPTAALAIQTVLRRFGCALTLVHNGVEAVEKATQNQYDVIFMDVGLPDIDGLEVTRRIRNIETSHSQVPIIALTGHVGAEQRQSCLDAGMNEVLNKPAQPLKLESVLKRFVWQSKTQMQKSNEPSSSASDTPTDTLSAIDWKGCVRLCGDEAQAQQLLSVCAEELKRFQEMIRVAYEENDIHTLRAELHRCLGGICYLRLPSVERALKAFQSEIKAELPNPQKIKTAYKALQVALADFWWAYLKRNKN